MSARLVKWHRTHPGAGSTFSKCGRFSIKPAKSGRAYVGFTLKKEGTSSPPGASSRSWSEDHGNFSTIPKAKAAAERIAKTELAERSDRQDFERAPRAAKLAKKPAPDLLDAAIEALAAMDTLAGDGSLPMICEHSREALRSAIAAANLRASR